MKISDYYIVYSALHEDIANCNVWISKDERFKHRTVIKITNNVTHKSVHCEYYGIDENFIEYYKSRYQTKNINKDDKVIVINQWYRKILGITATGETVSLTIKPYNNYFRRLLLNLNHPQSIIRISLFLGIISVLLGLLSIVLSVLNKG